jgi:hypothetical protein
MGSQRPHTTIAHLNSNLLLLATCAVLQCYTNSADNLDLVPNPECPPETDSLLRIRSGKLQQPKPCINPGLPDSRREWTSAKIDTKGKLLVQWKAPQVSCSLQEAVVRASAVQYDSQGQPVGPCGSVIVEARMKVRIVEARMAAGEQQVPLAVVVHQATRNTCRA